MKSDLKWMLLGIFLAVASCWCMVIASVSVVFAVLGYYVFPILAIISFAVGFFRRGE